jgi:hypothetical protein
MTEARPVSGRGREEKQDRRSQTAPQVMPTAWCPHVRDRAAGVYRILATRRHPSAPGNLEFHRVRGNVGFTRETASL